MTSNSKCSIVSVDGKQYRRNVCERKDSKRVEVLYYSCVESKQSEFKLVGYTRCNTG